MRRTIAVASTAAALLFGGAGVAQAGFTPVGAPASTTTTVAQDDYGINNNDNHSGLWGLAGLLGLLGLLGLRRHGDHDTHRVTTGSRVAESGTLVAGHGTGSGSTSGASTTAPRPNPGSTPPPTI